MGIWTPDLINQNPGEVDEELCCCCLSRVSMRLRLSMSSCTKITLPPLLHIHQTKNTTTHDFTKDMRQ
jgi:hypothetical protein